MRPNQPPKDPVNVKLVLYLQFYISSLLPHTKNSLDNSQKNQSRKIQTWGSPRKNVMSKKKIKWL